MAKKKNKKKNQKTEIDLTPRNYVAKHAREFNQATVETDRKKESKKNGHVNKKHKNRQFKDW